MKSLVAMSMFALAACATVPTLAQGGPNQVTLPSTAPYTLPDLPYANDALTVAIDAETMQIHHDRHHAAYITNLNAALAERPDLAALPLESLLARASSLPPAIRNNGGGHYNHSLFWRLMAPPGTGGQPSAELLAQINRDFGSLDAFKTAFNRAATAQFGSGWAWLVWTDGRLQITSTPNQDNPLMDVAPLRGAPLLAVDVWEHAYYLRYQNRRADYLTAWWGVVNWNEVNRLYISARG
ncbi:MAG: superoxide dismutase [Terricaulis sp.]